MTEIKTALVAAIAALLLAFGAIPAEGTRRVLQTPPSRIRRAAGTGHC